MIEVKQTESGRWGLYVNDILIGDSKSRFDADHAKAMLEKALSMGHVPPGPHIVNSDNTDWV